MRVYNSRVRALVAALLHAELKNVLQLAGTPRLSDVDASVIAAVPRSALRFYDKGTPL
jgi:hypothetical protein